MKKIFLGASVLFFSLTGFANERTQQKCFDKAKEAALALYGINSVGIQGSAPSIVEETFAAALQSTADLENGQIKRHKLKLTLDDSNDEGEGWTVPYHLTVEESQDDCMVRRIYEAKTQF